MKKYAFILYSLFAASTLYAVSPDKELIVRKIPTYKYRVDLTDRENDRLKVELTLPPAIFYESRVVFCFPKVIPGIYAEMNFGKHIDSLRAFSNKGTALPVKRLSTNEWQIDQAYSLQHISYQVNDAWEAFSPNNTGMYFSAESSFDDDFFVLNTHNLFGFLRKYENYPFYLEIHYPRGFYGAGSLKRYDEAPGADYLYAPDYRTLADRPMMYCKPDTAFIQVGETRVCVAVYSTSAQAMASRIAEHIEPLLQEQRVFLGGKLPVESYTFLIHHNADAPPQSYRADGLEHHNSTLILLNMRPDPDLIRANVYGIASHEFLHTLIPLALHSEQIHNFNFMQPEMSQHLWLYEGLTEYFTQLLPIYSGNISTGEFLEQMSRKVKQMQEYDNTQSLTRMSRQALQRQDQYYNFYLKGALVNMCLDIYLRELSGGTYGVQHMVAGLLKIYNKDKPFRDKDLFNEIARISYGKPIRLFFRRYVEGGNPLPLSEYLAKAGIQYQATTHVLSEMSTASEQQLKIRKSWLNR